MTTNISRTATSVTAIVASWSREPADGRSSSCGPADDRAHEDRGETQIPARRAVLRAEVGEEHIRGDADDESAESRRADPLREVLERERRELKASPPPRTEDRTGSGR